MLQLHDMLQQVPQLATECITCSSLRQLRRVSKGICVAMLDHVHEFPLRLNGVGVEMFGLMSCLKPAKPAKHAKLKRLRVEVVQQFGHYEWEPYASQLSCFVSTMRDAVKGVTHLKIATKYLSNYHPVDVAKLGIDQLARACPAVRQLWVGGIISPDVLSKFGTNCVSLDTLKVSASLVCEAQDVHLQLPSLRHVEVDDEANYHRFVPFTKTLAIILSCRVLTSIIAPCIELKNDVWKILPDTLVHLEFGLNAPISAESRTLDHLLTLKGHSSNNECSNIGVATVLSIVKCAPMLSKVEVGTSLRKLSDTAMYMETWCSPESMAALVLLDGYVSKGRLEMPQGLHIMLKPGVMPRYTPGDVIIAHRLEHAVESLPDPLLSIKGLHVESWWSDQKDHASDVFAHKFPNIKTFSSRCMNMLSPRDLIQISKLSSLERMSLDVITKQGFSDLSGLSMLCSSVKSLKVLRLIDQLGEYDEGHQRLQEILDESGIAVRVEQVKQS